MSTNLAVTTTVTIGLAFLGYLITYLNNVRLAQRTERLERVNRQLGELYGPLFALNQASTIAWDAFRSKYRPNQIGFFRSDPPPNEEELEAWRLWMSTVFMPTNLRMYELILSKSDLLIEPEMPDCLLILCAHVAAYKTVIKKWEDGDFSEHLSLVAYPRDSLREYTQHSFEHLKAEQEKLTGKKRRAFLRRVGQGGEGQAD